MSFCIINTCAMALLGKPVVAQALNLKAQLEYLVFHHYHGGTVVLPTCIIPL